MAGTVLLDGSQTVQAFPIIFLQCSSSIPQPCNYQTTSISSHHSRLFFCCWFSTSRSYSSNTPFSKSLALGFKCAADKWFKLWAPLGSGDFYQHWLMLNNLTSNSREITLDHLLSHHHLLFAFSQYQSSFRVGVQISIHFQNLAQLLLELYIIFTIDNVQPHCFLLCTLGITLISQNGICTSMTIIGYIYGTTTNLVKTLWMGLWKVTFVLLCQLQQSIWGRKSF